MPPAHCHPAAQPQCWQFRNILITKAVIVDDLLGPAPLDMPFRKFEGMNNKSAGFRLPRHLLLNGQTPCLLGNEKDIRKAETSL